MSDEQAVRQGLAGLSDEALVSVLREAVAGRPALTEVATALEQAGHAPGAADVKPDTGTVEAELLPPATSDESAQVGAPNAVPTVPGSPGGSVAPAATGGYSSSGVPTFDSVRDKVEQRIGTAQGRDELDRQTPAGRSVDEQWEAREKAARERLEQIRKSLHGDG